MRRAMIRSGVQYIGRFRDLVSFSDFARGGLSFAVATAALLLSNFLYHVILSRMIGPDKYGVLGALLNVILLFSVPLNALQAAVTREESSRRATSAPGIQVRIAVLRAFALGVVSTGFVALLSPFLAQFLRLPSALSVVMLSLYLAPAVVAAVIQGILMGRVRFMPVSVGILSGGVTGRLVLGILFVSIGFGVEGAVAAVVIGQLISLGIVCAPLWSEIFGRTGDGQGISLRNAVLPMLSLTGYWVLTSGDTILARHFLDPLSAGYYASANTASRVALLLPSTIGIIAFPKFSEHFARGTSARRAVRGSIGVAAALGLPPALVMAAFPKFVVSIMFGSAYVLAASPVRVLGFEGAGLGVIGLLVYFQLARSSMASLICWIGAVFECVGTLFFHATTVDIAEVMLSTIALTLFSLLAAVQISIRKRTSGLSEVAWE